MDDVKLDGSGVAHLLKSPEMHRLVQSVAEKIASEVEGLGIGVGDKDGGKHEIPLPVKVDITSTDRAHARVTLAHPAGAAVEAKHGALVKGASSAGLRVN